MFESGKALEVRVVFRKPGCVSECMRDDIRPRSKWSHTLRREIAPVRNRSFFGVRGQFLSVEIDPVQLKAGQYVLCVGFPIHLSKHFERSTEAQFFESSTVSRTLRGADGLFTPRLRWFFRNQLFSTVSRRRIFLPAYMRVQARLR